MNFSETILEIHKIIKWLEENSASNDVNLISVQLNKLSVHSFHFSEAVSMAEAEAANDENDYKSTVAEFVAGQTSVTKAEREAETKFAANRKKAVESKSTAKALKLKLDRIDRIMDAYKQRVSVIKQSELKGI